MALVALEQPIDPDAFLDWEQRQAQRYELVAGEVRLMVGASMGHNTVADNFHVALANHLRRSACRAWRADTRVKSPDGQFTYPDVVVSCTPRRSDELFIDDPVLVVEVLSPSTAPCDQGEKRWVYQAMPTLRQLLVVSPREPKAEIVTREADGSWRSVFVMGRDTTLALGPLEVSLPMSEICADIVFTDAARYPD
jgi:Uma2 family endonuclease